jgi:tight adherence protein B
MAAAVVTFAVIFAIVLGTYWLFVARDEGKAHQALRKRLRPQEAAARKGGVVIKGQRNAGATPFKGLQSVIDQSGRKITVPALLFFCVVAGFAGGLTVWTASAEWMIALAAGALTSMIPYGLIKHLAGKRMRKFEEQFPEAIDLIGRALRAGHALPTGLSMVADELGDPVGPEFKLLYDRQNFGMPITDALRSFAARVPILDARFFVTAVLTQREAGGNLSGVLDNLSAVIRERFKVKRQVNVISAQGRLTAAILVALPMAVGVMQFLMVPQNLTTLIHDPMGQTMLMGAAGMQIVGVLWIRKIVRIEY